jgi:phenylalanyl-tRNA synthetase alpha chain
MNMIKEQINTVEKDFSAALSSAASVEELEQIRIQFLGRSGILTALMGTLKELPVEDKRIAGPVLNELKKKLEHDFEQKLYNLTTQAAQAATVKKRWFDVTMEKPSPFKGTQHVSTQVIDMLEDIFISMGYEIADGPEVETDYYNFEALNIPADHPARDMHDTFWLDIPGMLLRTHTSPVQVRMMEKQKAPIAVFAPGRVYRNEATDATHEFMFTQTEGLFVDKNVSMANLLATAKTFLQKIFEKDDLTIRVRPSYFPFVEPGVEIDISCPFCTDGCSTCKRTRWIELLGAGLIHPHVLRSCNIDPDTYSGFAFGMGLERLAMIKYGITDVRLFHSSKINFLNQF